MPCIPNGLHATGNFLLNLKWSLFLRRALFKFLLLCSGCFVTSRVCLNGDLSTMLKSCYIKISHTHLAGLLWRCIYMCVIGSKGFFHQDWLVSQEYLVPEAQEWHWPESEMVGQTQTLHHTVDHMASQTHTQLHTHTAIWVIQMSIRSNLPHVTQDLES